MRRRWYHRFVVMALMGGLLALAACNKKDQEPLSQGPGNGGGPGGGGWQGKGGPGRSNSPIGQVMNKVGKGPQSLNSLITQELKEDPTPWDKIQPQAKEYAELTTSLKGYDPPKGEKDSWVKLSEAFAKSAEDLNKAAQAKNKGAAEAASGALNQSCMACHKEHRGGPGMMMRGPGGFGPQGGPPGGPPGGQPKGPPPQN